MTRAVIRPGVTLVELLVTMTILGTLAGVAAMAIRRIDAPNPDDPRQVIADTMRVVVTRARPAHVRLMLFENAVNATINADGSIIADSALGFERFTALPARPAHAR